MKSKERDEEQEEKKMRRKARKKRRTRKGGKKRGKGERPCKEREQGRGKTGRETRERS